MDIDSDAFAVSLEHEANQVIDSYGAALPRCNLLNALQAISQRLHDMSPLIVFPSGASRSIPLFLVLLLFSW